jgi:hypothetical protein
VTVQGGGGGKKVPSASTPKTALPTTPTTTTATTPTTKAATSAPPAVVVDGFEVGGLPTGERATPVFETHTASGIDSMVRVLEETRANILDEHRLLRGRISKLVAELVRSGFEQSAMQERHAELQSLRTRMAALRRRLQQIQRRLKTVVGKTKTNDAELGKQLTTQLDRLRKLEPGLERALLALQMMEVAFVEAWGGRTVKVADVIDGDGADVVGTAIAHAAPGAAAAVGIVNALGNGVGANAEDDDDADADDAGDDAADQDGLRRLQRLAASIKKSL